MISLVQLLKEVQSSPKAIFMAGPAGAGKTFTLNKLGIKGIRYKDAMSRDADEGTSNFVVFDPKEVKILEKNSKPVSRKDIIEEQVNNLK
jgi:predicted AAA+ superfamily ATPase